MLTLDGRMNLMTEDPITQMEAWIAFVDMRKAKGKRAPFTEFARTRILFELRRLQADGHDIDEVLWTSVTNGWSGVFPIKRKGWQAPSLAETAPSKAVNATQQLLADQKAHADRVEAQRLARLALKEKA